MRCSRSRPTSAGANGQAAYLSRGVFIPRSSVSVTCPTGIIQEAKAFQNEAPLPNAWPWRSHRGTLTPWP
jgi:hypothetical protein